MTIVRSKTIRATASLVAAGVLGVAIVAIALENAAGTEPDIGISVEAAGIVVSGRGTVPPLEPPGTRGPIPTIGGGTVVLPTVASPTVTRPG